MLKLVVLDASALVEYVLRTTRSAPVARVVEDADSDLHVPALCDVEVAAALRRGMLSRRLNERRAEQALTDYLDLPIARHGHTSLVHRALALHPNFSAYDAVYVALAERLGAVLLTADESLARAARRHTEVHSPLASG
ncbi:MAG: type II toxin-antitoxin system VapC family toxin [Gemmatimonadota bacterium]